VKELTPYEQMLARELAARHEIPKSTVAHPPGVIVPDDAFMTEKLRDPDYVPYCMRCSPMQRLRRVVDGFECPTCGNKANWDLTTFNNNVDVQFDPMYLPTASLDNIPPSKLDPSKAHLDWSEDEGKKNTSYHKCNKCTQTFFGKNSRKYCLSCQEDVSRHVTSKRNDACTEPFAALNRKERRQR
jgi:hypothetical protein